ncbi:MAG: ABC transporter permease [Candidatus Helarchaeota archaeon]
MPETITVYEPDNSLKKGYLNIFREIGHDLKENRWLTWQLFKRDFIATYRQSFIGILWAFIIPLITVGTFVIMNQSGIIDVGSISTPYPIYAIFGIAYWQLFSTGLVNCSNSLVNAGPMVVKINFSKKSLVISALGQSIVSFLVQFILICILFIIYGFIPDISLLLTIFFMIPIILLTLGFGFLLSILNGIARDIGNLISVLVTFLMFLTPILYSKPDSGFLLTLTLINPLYYLITAPRELMLLGTMSEWLGYLISCIFSIIIFVLSLVIFHLTETRVTERI